MVDNLRWKRRPAGSNWGDFGPDDQIGRLNLVTSAKVLQGVAEVREGKVFCLSLPVDVGYFPGTTRKAPTIQPVTKNGMARANYPMSQINRKFVDFVNDDVATIYTQYSTQWDSLAHIGLLFDGGLGDGPAAFYYNGYRGGEHVLGEPSATPRQEPTGCASKLGIGSMAEHGVQGRAVMIDLMAHFGVCDKLVGYDDLMRVIERDRVVVEAGDFVCLRTGFDNVLIEECARPAPDPAPLAKAAMALDGRDENLLQWITDSGLVALISDHYSVERLPARVIDGDDSFAAFPLHEHCLFKLGVFLGELFRLSELADWLRAHRRSHFLLTAPPLRLTGAIGGPVTAVGTV